MGHAVRDKYLLARLSGVGMLLSLTNDEFPRSLTPFLAAGILQSVRDGGQVDAGPD
ncbi:MULTISPECIES: hypothetical protein [unclassified Mesorhizobium]|uniref:hypothetical protein n=1 Tax=unclassified Mesorhizobium TaxID=325217 RepID=UPI00167B3F1C|nr:MULTISPECIES: hypothetical protein [unclassified Mesorhizobium]